jgi:predicted nuclease of restriction endonuclease-like (RecB) superfamily
MKNNITFKIDFEKITSLIAKAQINALKTVNKELINLYWEVGKYVSEKVGSGNWGKSVVEELSIFINSKYPSVKGFSSRNIWRMKQFFETYFQTPELSTLWTEISWSHNRLIFSKSKTIEEKKFYLLLAKKERLSVRELERQINSGVFERTMLANIKRIANGGRNLSRIRKCF